MDDGREVSFVLIYDAVEKKKVVCSPSIGPRSMQFQTIANLQMMSDTDVIVGIHHTSDK